MRIIFDVSKEIGLPATLEQCAEECNELSHACLKLTRILRGENPTPVPKSAAIEALREEAADVMVCIESLIKAGLFTHHELTSDMVVKIDRWKFRLEETNKN